MIILGRGIADTFSPRILKADLVEAHWELWETRPPETTVSVIGLTRQLLFQGLNKRMSTFGARVKERGRNNQMLSIPWKVSS